MTILKAFHHGIGISILIRAYWRIALHDKDAGRLIQTLQEDLRAEIKLEPSTMAFMEALHIAKQTSVETLLFRDGN